MVAGQKIALGRLHAGQVVTIHVADATLAIELGGDNVRTVRRTTTQPVRSIKAQTSSRDRAGWRALPDANSRAVPGLVGRPGSRR